MRTLPAPSEQLKSILDQLRPFCGAVEVTLPGESFDILVDQLAILRGMLISLEHEVGALRLGEAARQGRTLVDQLATDQLNALVADPEGKIVRPNFGGRS